MPQVSTLEKEAFRNLYDSGESISQIAKKFEHDTETVWRWLKQSGKTRTPKEGWLLAKRAGRVPDPPKNRVRFFNESFFDTSSAEMMWVLGLMFGDGNVRPNGRILLACGKDEDLARKVSRLLEYSGALLYKRHCWMLELSSKKCVESLGRWGVTPAKTYTMRFPEVTQEFLPHFVRGLWESDGSVYVDGRGFIHLAYSSASGDFVASLRDVIKNQVGIQAKVQKPHGIDKHGRIKRSFTIAYGTRSAEKLAQWLYGGSSIASRCDRKWQKVLESGAM